MHHSYKTEEQKHLNKLLKFSNKLLSFGNRLSCNRFVGALTDVVEFRENAVTKVRAGHSEQTVGGDKSWFTTADSFTPLTQLAKLSLQAVNTNYSNETDTGSVV